VPLLKPRMVAEYGHSRWSLHGWRKESPRSTRARDKIGNPTSTGKTGSFIVGCCRGSPRIRGPAQHIAVQYPFEASGGRRCCRDFILSGEQEASSRSRPRSNWHSYAQFVIVAVNGYTKDDVPPNDDGGRPRDSSWPWRKRHGRAQTATRPTRAASSLHLRRRLSRRGLTEGHPGIFRSHRRGCTPSGRAKAGGFQST
jgi:hypothetical protein